MTVALAATVAVISPATRERVTRMVHEATITMRQQLARDATPRGRACWPDYVYERDDHGDRPAIEELRALVPLWTATARHIDEMEWVFIECFGRWANPRSKRNGLERWQWTLLELRAWQAVYGWRGGWRQIASSLELRPHMPTLSHAWCRIEHNRLIDVACVRAREDGRC